MPETKQPTGNDATKEDTATAQKESSTPSFFDTSSWVNVASFGANVAGAFVLGLVMIILGVVILAARPIMAVAGSTTPVGKALTVASKVAGK